MNVLCDLFVCLFYSAVLSLGVGTGPGTLSVLHGGELKSECSYSRQTGPLGHEQVGRHDG